MLGWVLFCVDGSSDCDVGLHGGLIFYEDWGNEFRFCIVTEGVGKNGVPYYGFVARVLVSWPMCPSFVYVFVRVSFCLYAAVGVGLYNKRRRCGM